VWDWLYVSAVHDCLIVCDLIGESDYRTVSSRIIDTAATGKQFPAIYPIGW